MIENKNKLSKNEYSAKLDSKPSELMELIYKTPLALYDLPRRKNYNIKSEDENR